jgi:toxin ParE1/3/4
MSARKTAIRLTREAADDLTNISMYSWQTCGEEQATIYEAAIARTLASLRQYPQLGRTRDNMFPGCRSVQVQQHVIYYHQSGETEIEVVRILHRGQDASSEVREPST